MSLPMVGLMGLSIDYAIWNQIHGGLGLAADNQSFNTTVTQVYPFRGEAGNRWSTAESTVGSPPDAAGAVDVSKEAVLF